MGVIALIFIGPRQLPELARTVGRLLNELKRASSDFQQSFTEPIKQDLITRIEDTRSQNLDPVIQPPVEEPLTSAAPDAEAGSKLPRGNGDA